MLIYILRLLPPETAHQITIKLLKSSLIISGKKNEEFKSLKQTILGIDFVNPLGLAAGFDKNAEVIKPMLSYGFGFVEVGTITPRPQKGNPKPRIFRLKEDEAVINHLGFNNFGSERILKNLKLYGVEETINVIEKAIKLKKL